MILDGSLQLDNVFFVPQLTCNLIFLYLNYLMPQNYIVQFTNTLCVI